MKKRIFELGYVIAEGPLNVPSGPLKKELDGSIRIRSVKGDDDDGYRAWKDSIK